jgi:hypothetical protein
MQAILGFSLIHIGPLSNAADILRGSVIKGVSNGKDPTEVCLPPQMQTDFYWFMKKPDCKPHWLPFNCESGKAYVNPETWKRDWSVSGELT